MPVNKVNHTYILSDDWEQVNYEVKDTLSQLIEALEKKNIKLNKDKSSYKWVLSEKGVEYATTDNS